MRTIKIGVPLFAVSVAAILTLSLSPPAVKKHPSVASGRSPAQRAVIFPIILSGYATINDGADHIRAVSEPAREWGTAGAMGHVYPALEHIPLTGTNSIPDPEQVLYLRPDAVLAFAGQAGALKKTGVPGLTEIPINPASPIQSRTETWKTIGRITGKDARSAWLVKRYAAKIGAVQMGLSPGPSKQVRVLDLHITRGVWWTANIFGYRQELVGARDAGKHIRFSGKPDLEQLLLTDPDVILFNVNPGDNSAIREIVGRPEFQAVRAIRERRAYKLPEHTYANEPVEDPLLLTWMAEVFYPDVMPRRLRDEYKETYREVYHYAISDDEIDKAIYLDENRFSAGYDRFVRQKAGP